MTSIIANIARTGPVILVGAILTTIGSSGEAAAKHHRKARLHTHRFAESHAPLLPQQPVRLGPMRYYGGPKSPMWRGPVEN